VVFSNEVCSTFTAMSSRTLLSDRIFVTVVDVLIVIIIIIVVIIVTTTKTAIIIIIIIIEFVLLICALVR